VKKTVVVLMVTLLSFLVTGCGIKEKIEQKAAEKIAETIVEQALSDGNTKVDIDGDTFTVKGEDGASFTLGGTQWPDIDYLPEFKKGQIISASNDGEGNVMIIVEDVDQQDYNDYLEKIKNEFTEETNEMQVEEYLLYEGKNAAGELVAVQYFKEDNSLTIIGNRDSE
jgi:hypothetical protein